MQQCYRSENRLDGNQNRSQLTTQDRKGYGCSRLSVQLASMRGWRIVAKRAVRRKKAYLPKSIREAIQQSTDSIRILAERYNISPTTVQKWKSRETTEDKRRGPKVPHSTVLTEGEEAIVVLFRRQTRLSLDDCLYALQGSIPNLSRASLYRCFRRHEAGSLSSTSVQTSGAKKSDSSIGCFSIGVIPVQAKDGVGDLFIALDRTSKFAFVSFIRQVTKSRFLLLEQLISSTPFIVHTIISHHSSILDNKVDEGTKPRLFFRSICASFGIQYVEVKSSGKRGDARKKVDSISIAEDLVREYRFTCEEISNLVEQNTFNYNSTRRLKALNGRTPLEYLTKECREHPERFRSSPTELIGPKNSNAK